MVGPTLGAGAGSGRLSAFLMKLRVPNAALLFACCSMYFGTGWSMGLFTFPIKPLLTVKNYALEYVPEIASATAFLTVMTYVMYACIALMIYTEWRTPFRWMPFLVFGSVTASTVLTVYGIFPYNRMMAAGITDQNQLDQILNIFEQRSWIRIFLWSFQWSVVMIWFARQVRWS
jgi:hypothetical protein